MTFWSWLAHVNWWEVVRFAVIPIAAILIPTVIAVRLSRTERLAAERSRYLATRLAASEGVMRSLASMISFDPDNELLRDEKGAFRAHVAIYRTALVGTDLLSGDWLGLKFTEGMQLWENGLLELQHRRGFGPVDEATKFEVLDPPRRWASNTMETLSGWLGGHVSDEVIAAEAAALYASQTSHHRRD